MTKFVLMLTRDDVTVPDAHAILELALVGRHRAHWLQGHRSAARWMAALVDTIHAAGRHAHLEVVSLTEADARNSLQLGRELGFDYVVGGTRWRLGAELLAGTSIRYFPTPVPSSVTRAPWTGPPNRSWPTSRPCGSPSPASICWPIATSVWTVTRSYKKSAPPLRSRSSTGCRRVASTSQGKTSMRPVLNSRTCMPDNIFRPLLTAQSGTIQGRD